jgi:hypothetical protein
LREQLTVAFKFILPVAVDCNQPTRGAATTEVEPFYVFAILVERHSDSDLEFLSSAF